jgi:hypothetical protein
MPPRLPIPLTTTKKRKPTSGRRWLSSCGYLPHPKADSLRFRDNPINTILTNPSSPSREKTDASTGKKMAAMSLAVRQAAILGCGKKA